MLGVLLAMACANAFVTRESQRLSRDLERLRVEEAPFIAARTGSELGQLIGAVAERRLSDSEAATAELMRWVDTIFVRADMWRGLEANRTTDDLGFSAMSPGYDDPAATIDALVAMADDALADPTDRRLAALAEALKDASKFYTRLYGDWWAYYGEHMARLDARIGDLRWFSGALSLGQIAIGVLMAGVILLQQRRLDEDRRRYVHAMEGAADVLFDWTPRTDALVLSRRFSEIAGAAPAPTTSKGFIAMVRPADREKLIAALDAAREEATQINVMCRLRRFDGSDAVIQLRGASVRKRKRALRVYGAITDVTEQVATTHRLTEAQNASQQLEANLRVEREVNGLQRQFVSMVSHEFRTPLTVIDGKARQLMRKGQGLDPSDYTERLSVVRRSVSRLVELIESVLASSRLDEGKIVAQMQGVDVAALTMEVAETGRDLFPSHVVSTDIDPEIGTLMLDPTLMRQVLTNLVSNAGKYSDPGDSITVRARIETGGETLRISVADTGVGIPAAEHGRLFQRFFRASTSAGRPGTGIGLHLINHFVALHDGRMEVDSREGSGSTFHVVLPVKRAAAPAAGADAA